MFEQEEREGTSSQCHGAEHMRVTLGRSMLCLVFRLPNSALNVCCSAFAANNYIGIGLPEPYLKRKGPWEVMQGVNYASAGSGLLRTTNKQNVRDHYCINPAGSFVVIDVEIYQFPFLSSPELE